MGYCVVTGATGGIGGHLCEEFARHGLDLVLVARNEEALDALAARLRAEHGIACEPLACDLTGEGAARDLHQALTDADIVCDILVNNAGFGDQTEFLDADWERQENMVRLNVVALMHLTYLFGADMRARGHGKILNVSSVAAFVPGPHMATYFATKAFVLSFSEAVREELRGTGVTVTVLCPGTTDTGFWGAANMDARHVFAFMGAQSPEAVARLGYEAVMAGRALALHSLPTKLADLGARLMPRALVRRVTGSLLARRG